MVQHAPYVVWYTHATLFFESMIAYCPPFVRTAACMAILAACCLLTGCAVVTVTGAAVGAAASVAGLAVDATVGTAKVVGKVATAPFN